MFGQFQPAPQPIIIPPPCLELSNILFSGNVDALIQFFQQKQKTLQLHQIKNIFSFHVVNYIPVANIECTKNLFLLRAYKDILSQLFGEQTMKKILWDQVQLLKANYPLKSLNNPVTQWINHFLQNWDAALGHLNNVTDPKPVVQQGAEQKEIKQTDPDLDEKAHHSEVALDFADESNDQATEDLDLDEIARVSEFTRNLAEEKNNQTAKFVESVADPVIWNQNLSARDLSPSTFKKWFFANTFFVPIMQDYLEHRNETKSENSSPKPF
jgi:hypothetical protein